MFVRRRYLIVTSLAAAILETAAASHAVVTADAVVDFVPGAAPTAYWGPAYQASSALGLPRAQHDLPDLYDGAAPIAWHNYGYTTPFNPAFQPEEVAAIGAGGQITLHLSAPVATTGRNLGVHTDVGLIDAAYPSGSTTPVAGNFGDRYADVAVSADNVDWFSLGRVVFDLPSNYFTDAIADPSGQDVPTSLPTHVADFAKPFTGTPADFDGKDYAGVLAVLDGSAGGNWIDLSPAAALAPAVRYVRFSLPQGEPAGHFMYVDSVTAVPEPASAVAGCALAILALRRQK